MKSEYSGMTESLQAFLEKFHAFVLPTAENESRNLLVSSQKSQTQAMKQMAEQFSVQMADSFEKVITPTFQKMNDSLDTLVNAVTRCQQDAVKDILDAFLEEMNHSFHMQFADFNTALNDLKKAQKDNTDFTASLYQTMSSELGDAYTKQEKSMRELVTELGKMQNTFMATATEITQDNQKIQKMQQQDYQRISEYLKDAEKSSAKFWVACNQTMQKYVETATISMEKVSSTTQIGGDLLKANRRVVEEFDQKMQEFMEYQKLSYKTMDQVRRLLADITVARENQDVYLMGGVPKSLSASGNGKDLEKLQEILKDQGKLQEAFMEEMSKNIKDLSKAAQKGRFSLFK